MVLRKSIICASGLFVLFISAQVTSARLGPVAGENDLDRQQTDTAPAPQKNHPCFENRQAAKDAIRRLSSNYLDWLAEDAIYIITPQERCVFLHLETDDEREHFVEQFWRRRFVHSDSTDHDFKQEHYRRIVYANQKFGGEIPGWKMDRGRMYVLFGPPDSIEQVEDDGTANAARSQTAKTQVHPSEIWKYRHIPGLGDDVEFRFDYRDSYKEYELRLDETHPHLLAGLESSISPETQEQSPKIKFKDLEAIVVSGVNRDQVKFSHRVQFFAATKATTMARFEIQISCSSCANEGRVPASVAYPLFIRVSESSGHVLATAEPIADVASRKGVDTGFSVNATEDIPLAPGNYELAIAVKSAATGEAGVVHEHLQVPAYESLSVSRNQLPVTRVP